MDYLSYRTKFQYLVLKFESLRSWTVDSGVRTRLRDSKNNYELRTSRARAEKRSCIRTIITPIVI